MYRIELAPGEETAFRSIEELAVAIRRGIVTPRARIYHNATNTWLPIQFHPHYKLAFSMPLTQAALVAGPSAKPLSSLTLQVTPTPVIQTPAIVEEPKKTKRARKKRRTSESHASPVEKSIRRRGPSRRTVRLAFAGALLIACTQLALSAATPLNSKHSRSHRQFVVVKPAEAPKPASLSATDLAVTLPTAITTAVSKASPPPVKASFGAATPMQHSPTPVSRDTVSSPADEPVIEPAPASVDLVIPTISGVEALSRKLVDSSDKKTLKKILRAVSGASSRVHPLH
jgi:hypothetical protein